jgi:anti-anti-sigma factor
MSGDEQRITVRRVGTTPVIGFTRDEVSEPEYVELAQEDIYKLIKTERPPLVVIDCAEVKRLASIGMGLLMVAAKIAGEHGGRVCVTGLNQETRSLAETVKLHRLAGIYPTVDAAMEAERPA